MRLSLFRKFFRGRSFGSDTKLNHRLARQAGPLRRRQLFLEHLEERRLLARLTWDGGGVNDRWSTAANWVGDVAPISGAGDTLVFDSSLAGSKFSTNNTVNGFVVGAIEIIDDSATNNFTLFGQPIVLQSGLIAGGTENNTTTSFVSITLSSDQSFTLNAGSLLLGAIATNGKTLTVDGTSSNSVSAPGAISGGGSLVKAGSPTLALSGNNSYTGQTVVNGGILSIQSGGTLGSTAGNTVINAGGSLLLFDNVGTAEPISVAGTGVNNNGALQGGNNSQYQGPITLTSDTKIGVSNTNATLKIMGAIGDGGLGYGIDVGFSQTGQTLLLSGANTYSGATNVSTTGTLKLGAAGAFSDTSAVNLSLSSSLLDLNNLSETIGTLTGLGNVTLGSGTLTVQASSTSSLEGGISGTGGLIKTGNSQLSLSGANTYTGATAINNGRLIISGGNAIGNSNAVSVAAGASLELAASEEIGSLSGAGAVALGANTLTVGGDNSNSDYSGEISGTGGLTKTGSGVLTLGGSNTYSGATLISGGTLGGTATISGPVTVQSGAILAPGNSPGILHAGATTFQSGSQFKVEINGTAAGTDYDQLVTSGPVVLGSATLDASLGFAPAVGDRFVIIQNDSGQPIAPGFSGMAEGAVISLGGTLFQISYAGGDGDDVELSVPLLLSVQGVNWHDLNADGVRQAAEPGLHGWTVFADLNNNNSLDLGEPQATTQADNPNTPGDEAGRYELQLAAGSFAILREPQAGYAPSFPVELPLTAPGSFAVSKHLVTLGTQSLTGVDFGNFSARVVNFSASTQTVLENDVVLNIAAQLDTALGLDLFVPVIVAGGTATSADYQKLDAHLYFPAGSATGSLRLRVIEDTRHEANDTVTLAVQATLAAAPGASPTHTLTISNDDAPPKVFFSSPKQTAEEGSTIVVGVTLSAESDFPVTIPLSFSNHSAAVPGDYSISGSTTLTINAGNKASKLITIHSDGVGENAETIDVTLGTLINALPGNVLKHVITIPANERPDVNFGSYSGSSFTATTSATRTEGNTSIDVTVSLTNPIQQPLDIPIKIVGTSTLTRSEYDLKLGNTTLASDAFDGTLTIPASGQAHPTGTVQITLKGDLVDEDIERLQLTFGSFANSVAKAGTAGVFTLIVNDDDTAHIEFLADESSIYENGGSKSFNVKTSIPSTSAITVPIKVSSKNTSNPKSEYADSRDDFTALPQNYLVTIAAGQTTGTGSVTITNDTAYEADEKIVLHLGTPSRGDVLETAKKVHSIVIRDNDPVVSVVGNVSSIAEDATDRTVSFRVTVGADHVTNVPIKVTLAFSGSARNFIDYTVLPSSTVTREDGVYYATIPAGSISATVSVRVDNDNLDEPNEGITLRATAADNGAKISKTSPSDVITINDDDAPSTAVYLNPDVIVLNEYNIYPQDITIGLNKASAFDIYVAPLFTSDDGSTYPERDYIIRGLDGQVKYDLGGIKVNTLKIPAGYTQASFQIQLLDVPLYQGDRSLRMKLAGAVNARGSASSIYVYIVENEVELPPEDVLPGAVALDLDGEPYGYNGYPVGWYNPDNSADSLDFDGSGFSAVPVAAGVVAVQTQQGFLEGATAFFDGNFNGVRDFLDLNDDGFQDEGEPVEPFANTGLDGGFALSIPAQFDQDDSGFFEATEGRFVLSGGTDTSTALAWTTRMYAPMGIFAVTPLTTLVSELILTGEYGLVDAADRVIEAFALPPENLATFVPLAGLQTGDLTSGAYFAAHVGLYSTVVQIANLFAGATPLLAVDYFADFVYADFAAKIVDPESRADTSEPAIIADIISGVSYVTGVEFSAEIVGGAADIISAGNLAIAAIPNTGDAAYARALVKAKKVSQGAAAAALYEVGAGNTAIADAVSEYTGTNLQTKIDNTVVGDIFPPEIGITHARLTEGNSGTQVMEFQVRLLGEHGAAVSVDFATADGTATAASDYVTTAGTLTWQAGDNTGRTIQVPVNGDSLFEQDETIRLYLTNPQHAVVRRIMAIGFIVNDEAGAFATQSPPVPGDNEFKIQLSEERARFFRNSQEIMDGAFWQPLQLTVAGQEGQSDALTLDFSSDRYRSDVINYQGGGGTGIDTAVIYGGSFSTITMKLANSTDGQTLLDPSGSDALITFNWFGLEPFNISGGTTDEMIFELPAGVTDAVLEDADPTDADPALAGMLRLRSPSGHFETIEFASPANSITILGGNGADSIRITTLDPAFTGVVKLGKLADPAPHADSVTLLAAAGANLELQSGVTFSPESAAAGQSTAAAATILTGSTLAVNLGGTAPATQFDQLIASGQVTLDPAGPTLSISLGYSPTVNDSFVIIKNTTALPIDGEFAGRADNSEFWLGNAKFRVDYDGGDGSNDLVLTVVALNSNPTFTSQPAISVPENSTAVLTVTATDAEAPPQTVSFAITGGADAALFDLATTGELTFKTAPDFEGLHGNDYFVDVTASDGAGGTTAQTIQVTVADVSYAVSLEKVADAAEAGGAAKFRVRIPETSPVALNATYSTGGTATAGSDFATLTGAITLAAGSLSADIQVAATNDDIVEGSESVVITLSGVTGNPDFILSSTPALRSATASIADNDTAVVKLAASSSSVNESVAAGKHNVGVVLLITANGVAGSGKLGKSVSVNLQNLFSGSATSGSDYTFSPNPAVVQFASGQASQTKNVSVSIRNDTRAEFDETIVLGLNSLVDGTGGGVALALPTAHTLTVLDNDATLDFGDAPNTYKTTLAANGARHTATGPQIGANVSKEPDARTPLNGMGDTLDAGVNIPALTPGTTANITVVVSGTTGKLDAFLDLNGDGDFADSGEKIFDSVSLAVGTHTLAYAVPATAKAGSTYSRFRLSTAGGLSFHGAAPSGEVEDYPVKIERVAFGTTGNDTLTIVPIAPTGTVEVRRTGSTQVVRFAPTERVIVMGLAGDDTLRVTGSLTRGVFFYGQAGNDTLIGSTQNDVLVGGDGNDTISGLEGRDIVVGGAGIDRVYGWNAQPTGAAMDENVLIGNATSLDGNDQALFNLLTEWSSSNSFATRRTKMKAGLNGAALSTATVLNDSAVDTLLGTSGQNWFWNYTTAAKPDTMTNKKSTDPLN